MKQFQARIKLYFYVNSPDMTVNENLGPFFFFFLQIAKAVWMASFKKIEFHSEDFKQLEN